MLDWKRVGLAGHSLGGYAGLGMAGGLPGWKDARIRAVLALSPSVRPLLAQHALAGISVPVMYLGGTKDPEVTPYVGEAGGAYDQTRAPKYFVEFDRRAEHMSPLPTCATWAARRMRASAFTAVAFFDAWLQRQSFSAGIAAHKGEGLCDLRGCAAQRGSDTTPRPLRA